jgi:hypothetical protein
LCGEGVSALSKGENMNIPYEHTTIPPERRKADIEKLLKSQGIMDIQWTSYKGESVLRFLWHVQNSKGVEKEMMFEFKPPTIPAKRRIWSANDQRTIKATVQLEATAYRLLWNLLKNKLWAIRFGLESVEKEFLSHAVVSLPNGQTTTVGENIQGVFEAVRSPALTFEAERKVVDVPTEEKKE